MTAVVKAFGEWRTNAEMFADVAKLGYLDGRVLDCTYGDGNFWTVFRPRRFVAHDLYTYDSVDARSMTMHRRESFDTTVLDPPYAFRGRASKAFDAKYGVGKYRGANAVLELYFDIMVECVRLTRPAVKVQGRTEPVGGYVLVKCQDQVVSGAVRWQVDEITRFAESLGLVKVDMFTLNSYRAQPHGRSQHHARRNGSTLLVFQKRQPKRGRCR